MTRVKEQTKLKYRAALIALSKKRSFSITESAKHYRVSKHILYTGARLGYIISLDAYGEYKWNKEYEPTAELVDYLITQTYEYQREKYPIKQKVLDESVLPNYDDSDVSPLQSADEPIYLTEPDTPSFKQLEIEFDSVEKTANADILESIRKLSDIVFEVVATMHGMPTDQKMKLAADITDIKTKAGTIL